MFPVCLSVGVGNHEDNFRKEKANLLPEQLEFSLKKFLCRFVLSVLLTWFLSIRQLFWAISWGKGTTGQLDLLRTEGQIPLILLNLPYTYTRIQQIT